MAKLWITEFASLGRSGPGYWVPVASMPPVAEQVVDFTISTPSLPFSNRTQFIRVVSDADAHLSFGDNPLADVDSLRLPADLSEYFGVYQGTRLAAYDGVS